MEEAHRIVQQLWPGFPVEECHAWVQWVATQPQYCTYRVGSAGCIAKVYVLEDPPYLRLAQEVAWWGHGREAVRALHRSMDWARLKGATLFGYSLAPNYLITKWKRL